MLHAGTDPARRLSFLYIAALSGIGVIALLSQVIIRTHIEKQRYDSKIVNISGRQRMLSQRLAKDLLLLERTDGPEGRLAILHRISANHSEWRRQHELLAGTGEGVFSDKINSKVVCDLFEKIQPFFDSIHLACATVEQRGWNISRTELEYTLSTLLRAEPFFLQYMDRITHQYEIEAAGRVNELMRMEIILFLATMAILILEGLFVFMPAARQIRSYFEHLTRKNTELSALTLELQENRRLLLSSSLDAQEKERHRISMELHDGLGPLIALAKLNVSQLEGQLPASQEVFAQKSLRFLNEIHDGIKHIARELMPPAIEQFGLEPVLQTLVEEVQMVTSAVINCYIHLQGISLPQPLALNVYRMSQELLNNAVKHSEAKEINLQVFLDGQHLVIMVEDDGKGLPVKDPLESPGLGLKNMVSRVNASGGSMTIDSDAQHGTTITIYLPVTIENAQN